MASLTHLVIGAVAGQHLARQPTLKPMCALSLISICPDFDVIGFSFGIRYASPWGHRGFTHSIAFAIALGVVTWFIMQRLHRRAPLARTPLYWGAIAGLVTLSHPLLDALTTGGLGVALWWPISEVRVFAPMRLIPVAPIGLGMLSPRGAAVIIHEAILCAPLWIYLAWPWLRRLRRAV